MADSSGALEGAVWDKIRALRAGVGRSEETVLDRSRVPAELEAVLPLARLFSTGEEGLWSEFAAVLDDSARQYIIDTIEGNRAKIESFVEISQTPLNDEAFAFLDLLRMYDYWGYDWDSVPRGPQRPPLDAGADELERKRAVVRDVLGGLKKS